MAGTGALDDLRDLIPELEKAGLPRALAEGCVAGWAALADQVVVEVEAELGGEEARLELVRWMDANLPERELVAFDDAVMGPNRAARLEAVRAMWSRYVAARAGAQLPEQSLTRGRDRRPGSSRRAPRYAGRSPRSLSRA